MADGRKRLTFSKSAKFTVLVKFKPHRKAKWKNHILRNRKAWATQDDL